MDTGPEPREGAPAPGSEPTDAATSEAAAGPSEPRPLGWASPAAERGPSDTVGTGSGIALGCTALMLVLVLVGIAVFVVIRFV